jgi:hypothetical protein
LDFLYGNTLEYCYMENRDKKLFNLIGLSEELHLPMQWLKQQVEAGNIPCLRFGKKQMRFNIEAVENAIADLAAKGSVNA